MHEQLRRQLRQRRHRLRVARPERAIPLRDPILRMSRSRLGLGMAALIRRTASEPAAHCISKAFCTVLNLDNSHSRDKGQ